MAAGSPPPTRRPSLSPAGAGSARVVAAVYRERVIPELRDGLVERRPETDAEVEAFGAAVRRGFLDEEATPAQAAVMRDRLRARELRAVYDDATGSPVPVGTIDGWDVELTTDVRRTLPMRAISGVTVSPTHRRRGIASYLVRRELDAAHERGIPLAGLTVSEATIYGRFGFEPAVHTTTWKVQTARARWVGPRPGGRLDALDRPTLAAALAEVHDAFRLDHPGETTGTQGLWTSLAGIVPESEDRKVRGVRYRDDSGQTRGVVAFTLSGDGDEFTGHTLSVRYLAALDHDAYAALWRFVLEHDLVAEVEASLRSADEPLRWMIADQRGATVTERDHQWFRILDTKRTLESRSYREAGSVVLSVDDPWGYAAGTWRFTVAADGSASVEPSDDEADLSLGVGALGAILLGGVRADTLSVAGHISGDTAWLTRTFAPTVLPTASIWY